MSQEKKNYSQTLNLPQTSFAMKANLTQRELQQRKKWDKMAIYQKICDARTNSPLYNLHDGPPYANGDIHMGHVINKVLKDIVVKYKTMAGFNGQTGDYELAVSAGVCSELALSDLNGDCIVNMQDFAILASEWLVCHKIPADLCQ